MLNHETETHNMKLFEKRMAELKARGLTTQDILKMTGSDYDVLYKDSVDSIIKFLEEKTNV
jgi:hypothetical protein